MPTYVRVFFSARRRLFAFGFQIGAFGLINEIQKLRRGKTNHEDLLEAKDFNIHYMPLSGLIGNSEIV